MTDDDISKDDDIPFAYRKGKNQDSARIYRMIRDAGPRGCTCDEIEVALGISHQSVSGRCTNMKDKGYIVDSGERRPTRTGTDAMVWIIAPREDVDEAA
jgi:predicted transcriptional regulator